MGMRLVAIDAARTPPLGVLDNVLGWLTHEVAHISKRYAPLSRSPSIALHLRSAYAPADLFVLLTWSCGLYTTCLAAAPDFVSSDAWPVLAGILATLLDLLLHPSTRSKPTMQKSALVRTRRALRSAPQHLPRLLSTLLALARSSQTPLVYIALLGTAVDVTIRLKNVQDESVKQITPSVKVRPRRPFLTRRCQTI